MAAHIPNNNEIKVNIGDSLNETMRSTGTQQESTASYTGATATDHGAIDNTPCITFKSGLNMMSSGKGSDILVSVVEELKKVYNSDDVKNNGYKTTVTSIDKAVKPNFAYSSVIVSINKANKVVYFTVLIEASGRKPMTATNIVEEINQAQRSPGQVRINDIYVASDAIDNVLHKEIVKQLRGIYKGSFKFYSAESTVIPYYKTDFKEENIRPLASIAMNSCIVEMGRINAEFRDLNINAAMKDSPNAFLKIESNMLPSTEVDPTGRPIRADWRIELDSIESNNTFNSPNMQNGKTTIVASKGFIDAMPIEIKTAQQMGMVDNTMIRLRPVVIINNLDVDVPTTGYGLLGIVSSLVMIRPNMWPAAVAPKAEDKLHDVGKLNIVTNLENNQNGVGEPLDLKDPKLNSQEVYALIRQMFSIDPMFSIDVDIAGATTPYTGVLSVAAGTGFSAEEQEYKYNAAQEIVAAANQLTAGLFPVDFNLNEIFIDSGITVPTGIWRDNNGNMRDLKDIDLTFIATNSGDTDLINKWALSNVPHSVSGIDPYISKVDVISKIVPSAEITGKAIRVTFNPLFISTLSAACAQAGFETRYDPVINFNEANNISVIGNYLSNAGISSQAADFARSFGGGQNTYQTPFANNGYNRYGY